MVDTKQSVMIFERCHMHFICKRRNCIEIKLKFVAHIKNKHVLSDKILNIMTQCSLNWYSRSSAEPVSLRTIQPSGLPYNATYVFSLTEKETNDWTNINKKNMSRLYVNHFKSGYFPRYDNCCTLLSNLCTVTQNMKFWTGVSKFKRGMGARAKPS